jgi:hypothetical protein
MHDTVMQGRGELSVTHWLTNIHFQILHLFIKLRSSLGLAANRFPGTPSPSTPSPSTLERRVLQISN